MRKGINEVVDAMEVRAWPYDMSLAIQRYSTRRGDSIRAENLEFYLNIHPNLELDYFMDQPCPPHLIKGRNMYLRLRNGAELGIHTHNTLGGSHGHCCPVCGAPKETARHILTDCPGYAGPRSRFIQHTPFHNDDLVNSKKILDIFLVPDNPTAPPGVVDRFYLWMADIAAIRNDAVAKSLPALSNSTAPVAS